MVDCMLAKYYNDSCIVSTVLMASPYPATIKFKFFQNFIKENGQNCYYK